MCKRPINKMRTTDLWLSIDEQLVKQLLIDDVVISTSFQNFDKMIKESQKV